MERKWIGGETYIYRGLESMSMQTIKNRSLWSKLMNLKKSEAKDDNTCLVKGPSKSI